MGNRDKFLKIPSIHRYFTENCAFHFSNYQCT